MIELLEAIEIDLIIAFEEDKENIPKRLRPYLEVALKKRKKIKEYCKKYPSKMKWL